MRLGLITLELMEALQKPGCPICRVKEEAEYRYLFFLLYENVNDGATRLQIVSSLGFCPPHTWQMGNIEIKQFGDAFGNSIIYENLVRVAHDRLAQYMRRVQAGQQSKFRGWLTRLLGQPRQWSYPDELHPQADCRVCQMGEQTVNVHLRWLLEGMSEPQPELRDYYVHSDRLCLQHLRQALELGDPQTESGAAFLAKDMLQYLSTLRVDLREYSGKRAWDRRFEPKTEGEKVSWFKAFQFFGGNERNDDDRHPD